MAMDTPRQILYHVSLNRYNMIMGADRSAILMTGMFSMILIVLIQTWWSIALGVLVWIVSVGILKRVGKVDPLMLQVAARHFLYKDYYPGQSGLDRKSVGTPVKWAGGKN
jgi:type IV secretion system protein VirB3